MLLAMQCLGCRADQVSVRQKSEDVTNEEYASFYEPLSNDRENLVCGR